MTPESIRALRRYLITDARAGTIDRMVGICEAAVAGGVTAIQLRAKGWTDRELYEAGLRLSSLCRESQVLFVVNDRVDIALAVDAAGVHLGVDDLPVGEARRLLGHDSIIGYSPEREDDRAAAEGAGATYLGIGPVYTTGTKSDAGEAIGPTGIQRIVDRTRLPVIGIGGITAGRATDVIAAGAVGVAVVGDVFLAADPEAAARRLAEAIP